MTLAGPAWADCRTSIGGDYFLPHGGWKVSGKPHSGFGYFNINPNGTFALDAVISEQPVDPNASFGTPDPSVPPGEPAVNPWIDEKLSGPWNGSAMMPATDA